MTNAPTPAGMAEETVRAAFQHFMHDAEFPCSASAMREAINLALAALAPVAAEGGEKDKLRIAVEALEPFAQVNTSGWGDESPVDEMDGLTAKHLRRAATAYAALRTEPTGETGGAL